MFCVECGAEGKLYGHLCRDCLMSKRLLEVPDYVEVHTCPSCQRVLDGPVWKTAPPESVAFSAISAATRGRPEVERIAWDIPPFPQEKGEHRVLCRAELTVGGEKVELEFEIGIRVRFEKCQACSRQSGDYYEAIIQLRMEGLAARHADVELAEEAQMLFSIVDEHAEREENAFITKYSAVQGGMDFYIGSVAVARTVANRFRNRYGASVNESPSLIGQKDGRDMYRYSILVRLPRFREGDVLAIDSRVYVVSSLSGKSIVLTEAETGKVIRVPQDDARPRLVAKHRDVREAVVVTYDDSTVQVLDPDTMAAVTLHRPRQLGDIGETVPVIRYDERLYIV